MYILFNNYMQERSCSMHSFQTQLPDESKIGEIGEEMMLRKISERAKEISKKGRNKINKPFE